MNEYTLALDLAKAKQRQQQTIFLRQGDKNATTIVATITDHGVAASTSGMTARFQMRLPNGTEYYRKTATLSGNVATVALDEAQAASVAGRTDVAYFQLLQGSTVVAESAREADQTDVLGKLADLEHRVWELEHPTDQYAIWQAGYQTKQHEIVRFDVTGDGELDLCQYNGGRSYTALSIGKIEGWNLLDRELTPTHTITRDADGGYVLTPVETEPTTEAGSE